MAIKGMTQVRRNVQAAFDKIKGPMAEAALTEALLIGSAQARTYVPVHTGALINSEYMWPIRRTSSGLWGAVGFTAEYAAAVHEASGKLKGMRRPDGSYYWSPGGEPKFLERGFEESVGAINKAIERRMKI